MVPSYIHSLLCYIPHISTLKQRTSLDNGTENDLSLLEALIYNHSIWNSPQGLVALLLGVSCNNLVYHLWKKWKRKKNTFKLQNIT